MIDGEPGTAFEDEVIVRRRRWASDETGFAVLDADRDGDEVVLVGAIAHLEERERVRISGVWQDDRRFGMQVKVATAEPLAPSGSDALIAYLRRVKHVGGVRAARLLERHGDRVLDEIDRDPHASFVAVGLSSAAGGRGGQVVERAALHAPAAPAARAARARLAGAADRQALRRGRARGRSRPAVRAHERVRGRLPHGRPDRPRGRRGGRFAGADARTGGARARRGGEGRLDLPACG